MAAALVVLVSLVSAAEDAPPAKNDGTPTAKNNVKPGDWIVLPDDGTPWTHEETGLRFPISLGGFRLRLGFRDRNAAAGVAISYVHESKNIRADVVLFPCGQDLNKIRDVMAFLRGEHDKLVKDLHKASQDQGYAELTHTDVEERAVNLWTDKAPEGQQMPMNQLPLTVQNFEFGPSVANDELVKPRTSQWFGLALFQDYFVQMSIVRPTVSGKEGETMRDDLVKLFLQCIREPSVGPEMLKLCKKYGESPLSKEGREAADALSEYSKASPVFKIIFPGDLLLPVLDKASEVNQESALDLLRAYIVGAAVVALQGGTADQCIEEGMRVMLPVYGELKKQNEKFKSDLMEELGPLSAKGLAASHLRKKMNEAKVAANPAATPAPPSK